MLITQADIDRVKRRLDDASDDIFPKRAFQHLPVDLLIALACGLLDATQVAMDELGNRGIVPDDDL